MKIIYMGTPEFAVPALKMLAESPHQVGYVISQPDKAKNRGKKMLPTPVKEEAEKYGIKVLQPEKIKSSEETIAILKEYKPDLAVVAAYGQILSKELLEIPRLGCINLHGSILPKYRGAAPIQRAIIDGEKETGVTLMQMEEGLDTGDMLAVEKTDIANKTYSELSKELAVLGAELLMRKLPEIEDNSILRIPQNDEEASYAHMLFKKDGELDFSKSAAELERLIRGFEGAYTFLNGEIFKVWKAEVVEADTGTAFGTVVSVGKDRIDVATSDGILSLAEVQAPGKKRMLAADFLRGAKITEGTILGGDN